MSIKINIFEEDDNLSNDEFIHKDGNFTLYCSFNLQIIHIVLIQDEEFQFSMNYYQKKSKRNLRKTKQFYWMKRLAHLQQLKLSQGAIIAKETHMTYKLMLKKQTLTVGNANLESYLKKLQKLYVEKMILPIQHNLIIQRLFNDLLGILFSQSLKQSLIKFLEQNGRDIQKMYIDQKYEKEKDLTKCAVCLQVLLQLNQQESSNLVIEQMNKRKSNFITHNSYCQNMGIYNWMKNQFNFNQTIILKQNKFISNFYLQQNKVKYLICSHGFHGKCIDKWLEVKNYCPVCKTKQRELPNNIYQNSLYSNPNYQQINEFQLFFFDDESYREYVQLQSLNRQIDFQSQQEEIHPIIVNHHSSNYSQTSSFSIIQSDQNLQNLNKDFLNNNLKKNAQQLQNHQDRNKKLQKQLKPINKQKIIKKKKNINKICLRSYDRQKYDKKSISSSNKSKQIFKNKRKFTNLTKQKHRKSSQESQNIDYILNKKSNKQYKYSKKQHIINQELKTRKQKCQEKPKKIQKVSRKLKEI